MTSDPRYRGLLIGNAAFPRDPHALPALRGPLVDIKELGQALTDDAVGLFSAASVLTLADRGVQELREILEEFFTAATREDVLLLYYSGHGRLDENGQLYLCAADTLYDRPRATALSAAEINNMIDGSAATTTVIVLDCCHSGAFKPGTDLATPIAGKGRYVLASNRSTHLARDAEVEGQPSPFTGMLIHGLRHADAAGHLTVGELYRQVHHWITEDTPRPPQLSFAGEGDVVIARRKKKRRRVQAQHRTSLVLPHPRQRIDDRTPTLEVSTERASHRSDVFEESWTGHEDPRKFCRKSTQGGLGMFAAGLGILIFLGPIFDPQGTVGSAFMYALGTCVALAGFNEIDDHAWLLPRRLRKRIRARTLRLDREGVTIADSSGAQRIPWDTISGASIRYADKTIPGYYANYRLLAFHLQIRQPKSGTPTILYHPAGWPENADLPDACRSSWLSEATWVPVCILGPLSGARKTDLKNVVAASSRLTLTREHELSEQGW